MKILLNGEAKEITGSCNLSQALVELSIDLPTRSAVALNAKVVSRDMFVHTFLSEEDELLIIRPTFGG